MAKAAIFSFSKMTPNDIHANQTTSFVRDRHTYASDLHLMTSRELTSGFDFWSRGHLCMAVMHLAMKFGANSFIRSGVIDISPKLKMMAAAILDLFG